MRYNSFLDTVEYECMVGRTVFVWFNTLKVTGCKFWYAINADRFWTT